jgi:hypothetical protein
MAAKTERGTAALKPELVSELKSKHGQRLYVIEDEEAGPIVFKPAAKEDWDAFVDAVGPDNTSDPTRTLFDACVVYPSVDECQRLHAEFPALADAVVVAIREKSGGRRGLEAKKL